MQNISFCGRWKGRWGVVEVLLSVESFVCQEFHEFIFKWSFSALNARTNHLFHFIKQFSRYVQKLQTPSKLALSVPVHTFNAISVAILEYFGWYFGVFRWYFRVLYTFKHFHLFWNEQKDFIEKLHGHLYALKCTIYLN